MMENHLEGTQKGRPRNIVSEPVSLGELHSGAVHIKTDRFGQVFEAALASGLFLLSLVILYSCDLVLATPLPAMGRFAALFALIVIQSALMTQMVMQFHDCLHFAVFRRAGFNTALARGIGAYCLWPATFLRESHLQHHRRAGLVDGDPEVLHFTAEFIERNSWAAGLNRLAQTRWAPLLFTPALQGIHFTRYFRLKLLVKRDISALGAYVGEIVLMVATWALITRFLKLPLHSYFVGHLLPSLIAMGLVYWAAKPLHTQMIGIPLPELDLAARTLSVARSFKSNRMVRLFFANLGFHIEHHLRPSVSRWALPSLAESLRPELEKLAREKQLPFAYHHSYRSWYREVGKRVPTQNTISTLDEWNIQNTTRV